MYPNEVYMVTHCAANGFLLFENESEKNVEKKLEEDWKSERERINAHTRKKMIWEENNNNFYIPSLTHSLENNDKRFGNECEMWVLLGMHECLFGRIFLFVFFSYDF